MANTNLLVLINLFCLLLSQYNPKKKPQPTSHYLHCKSCSCLGKAAFCIWKHLTMLLTQAGAHPPHSSRNYPYLHEVQISEKKSQLKD